MSNLTGNPIPVRASAAMVANVEIIIATGMAANRSSAVRAALAALARGLVGDPRVWVVETDGQIIDIYATEAAAAAWLDAEGATTRTAQGEWAILDEDGDAEAFYRLRAVTLK